MVEFYKKEQLEKIRIQKKKSLAIYFSVLAVFVLISLGLCLWFTTLTYKSPLEPAIRWPQYLITAAFIVFSFLFLGIRYKRERKYCKMLVNIETGRRETSIGSFFEYDDRIFMKDGVDVKALIFLEWNKYKQDFFERKVLVLAEMEFPVFEENQNVKYVTHGNVLVEYEILPDEEIEEEKEETQGE